MKDGKIEASDAEPHWSVDSGFPYGGDFISIEKANALLAAEREKLPVVYGRFDFGGVTMPFSKERMSGDTHTAKLCDIREIKK